MRNLIILILCLTTLFACQKEKNTSDIPEGKEINLKPYVGKSFSAMIIEYPSFAKEIQRLAGDKDGAAIMDILTKQNASLDYINDQYLAYSPNPGSACIVVDEKSSELYIAMKDAEGKLKTYINSQANALPDPFSIWIKLNN